MDKPRKKFAETKFGKLLTEKAPHLLGKVIDILPDGGILGAVKNIHNAITEDNKIDAESKADLLQLLHNQEMEAYLAEIQDRDSARNREIEVLKFGSKNYTQNILAYVGVICFFGMIAYILAKGLGNMNTEESFIIGNLTGLAGAIAKDIYGYYFGSSKSSAEKDKALHRNNVR